MKVDRQSLFKLSGIYAINYIPDHKVYVGSAVDLYKRGVAHKTELKKNIHSNKYLQNAWNKHGEQVFEFNVIEILSDVNKLIEREQYWIDTFDSTNRRYGYNINRIAGSTLGTKASLKTKQKLSKIHKGKRFTDEHKYKISKALKGRIKSKEHLQKISDSLKGKNTGKNNPFYGKTHSKITIKKIIKAHLGIKRPDHSLRMKGKNNPRWNKLLHQFDAM